MDTPALLIGRVSSAELSSGWKQDQIGRRATMTDNNLIGYEVKVTVEHMDTRGGP
jgi:hypothetical protein